ncbi:MAG: SGNH/GDSL hydrolase family protein [Marinilabiliaceae bacterium]|nr:SGNH/GDSL hydrolase family protein [Marinilabiliaceae bacterium]
MLYKDLPLDNLQALANARVPVMHMISLKDKIVPPEENTFKLINRYLRLGGIATVVTCVQEPQALEGHHFTIETPRRVADFIKYHSIKKSVINASNYHELRGGLMNSQLTFEREKKGRVAFLGGSITYNHGWRDSICDYLQNRFPETEFEFIEAGIPSMGTTPAAFRLERDVLSKGKIDLLFEEAAVNDGGNGRSDTEQIRAMEGIVRHLRQVNPSVDIVMMHFVDPAKMKDYNKGLEPQVIVNHNKVADHYQIPYINLAKEVTDRINNGEFTWADDFKNLHPSPFGQGVYARSMLQFLDAAFVKLVNADDKIMAYALPDKLDTHCYNNGTLLSIEKATLKTGWLVDENWKPKDQAGTRANYVNVPMLIAREPGAELSLSFEGRAVGIAIAAGPDAGSIQYRVDKGDWKALSLFTNWSQHLHLPWYYTLAAELEDSKHLLELRISDEKDARSVGNACRIRYFYCNP